MIMELHFETLQVHGGLHIDASGERGIAIRPTAAYVFRDCEYAANLFNLTEAGNIYTRLNNTTNSQYEERMAALYGGVGALAAASGMAAIFIVVSSLVEKGQNIVTSPYLYGGTYNQFRISLEKLGIEVRIAPTPDLADIEALIDDNTRFVFAESMGNPTCYVPDIEAYAAIAHRHDIPLVIDNTFGAGGYLCNPLRHGADIVVDSATKWINGHGTAMGGIIVDGGTFNWGNGKYPQIAGPDPGYHGTNLWEAFGPAAFIVKARVDGMRDFGVCSSPFDSYLMMLGLETLSLRCDREVESAKKIVEYLRKHPAVEMVSYVGSDDHPSYAMAQKYFRHGGGSVFSLTLKGDLDSTVRFVEALQIAKHMTMIGDSLTVVTHPASTTHKQLSEADMAQAGITPTLLRISIGLEHPDDIIADFEQALSKAKIS